MSRNLASRRCQTSGCRVEEVVLEETPRPITREEAGAYFYECEGMLVANAHCPACLALYLAWCDESPCVRHPSSRSIYWAPRTPERGYFDLSYRNAFNDEPATEDLPVFLVAPKKGGWRRIAPIHRDPEGDHSYFRKGDGQREARARWFARAEKAIAENDPPIEDGDLVSVAVALDEWLAGVPLSTYFMWPTKKAPDALVYLAALCLDGDVNRSDIVMWHATQAHLPMVLSIHLNWRATFPLPNGWVVAVAPWSGE